MTFSDVTSTLNPLNLALQHAIKQELAKEQAREQKFYEDNTLYAHVTEDYYKQPSNALHQRIIKLDNGQKLSSNLENFNMVSTIGEQVIITPSFHSEPITGYRISFEKSSDQTWAAIRSNDQYTIYGLDKKK